MSKLQEPGGLAATEQVGAMPAKSPCALPNCSACGAGKPGGSVRCKLLYYELAS
jgi:hypothetical protein